MVVTEGRHICRGFLRPRSVLESEQDSGYFQLPRFPRLLLIDFCTRSRKAPVRRGFLRVHSRTRKTIHPARRNAQETLLSRRLLTIIFAFQNVTLVPGGRLHRLHPCQKQPSTKTTIFGRRNTKSGFPGSVGSFIVHPATARRTR
jgi:hypothetical protein